MPWKINKHKKSDRQGRNRKKKQVRESQPKLKSCLKTTKDLVRHRDSFNDSSLFQDDSNHTTKTREQGSKSGSRGARSSSSYFSVDVGSKGSGNSSLGFNNRKRVASVEQHSVSSRSRGSESRKSETGQSTQTSERSCADSRSHVEETKKKVQFASIHIRDYERVVGDNPSCTIGPPVGIGWKYDETRVIDVDTFEASRTYKKSTSHLIISREEREALLLNWGASFHDIIEAVRGNLKIKNQRRQTVTNLGKIERIEEAFESATSKLKSALMLRRSTGNQVKRLQEQANLAQSALTSLKIAEDRAFSELRSPRMVEIVEEPKYQEDFNGFPMSNYGPSPEDTKVSPEEDDQPSKRYSLTGNSTSQSLVEIEKFYKELELEMFGDEESPSMVRQMLEVPLKNGDRNPIMDGIEFKSEDCSVNSGMTDRHSRGDLNDELLEKEENRSMISEYLLEDADNESPKVDHLPHDQGEVNRYFYTSQPLHRDQFPPQIHSAWNPSSALNFPSRSSVNEATMAREYQELYRSQQQTVPLHAGMTMFEDCALLGGQNGTSYYHVRTRRSSRKRDENDGPKVQFIPPPNHLTPSHWLDASDSNTIPPRGHDTVTIFEDNFDERTQIFEQDSQVYNNNGFPPNFY